jgi:MraZ protein
MLNFFDEKTFHSTDPKGRLLLPREIRDHFQIKKADTLYLIPNLSEPPYLEIRTAEQWDRYRESLRQQESGEKKKDSFRYAMMLKDTVTVDGQGRILLPQRIREMCRLDGAVAIVNMDLYVEVWAKDHMAQRYADMLRAFKEANDRMF